MDLLQDDVAALCGSLLLGTALLAGGTSFAAGGGGACGGPVQAQLVSPSAPT